MLIRGPILNPRPDGSVDHLPDGVVAGDDEGKITFVGTFDDFTTQGGPRDLPATRDAVFVPGFFDNHTHIPQHPIRGRFTEGIEGDPREGRLLAGLNRNVFPAEARCSDSQYTEHVVKEFLRDTLANGVIGGCAFMTVHTDATMQALSILPGTWSVGMVLMNMNCPEYLRTDELNLERDLHSLASDFGKRFVLTDRFAVTADSQLRRRALQTVEQFDLIAQTHLNEQQAEKSFVEKTLYPDAKSYTDVYLRDGLLDRFTILAHCIHMRDDEWQILKDKRCAVAHCPTSNLLLESGTMPLEKVFEFGLDYAICTDVGASPTTSMLFEMQQFLNVHRGISNHAMPTEALYRSTLAPARMLGLDDRFGSFDVGKTMSFVEIGMTQSGSDSEELLRQLLKGPVRQVVVAGQRLS